MIGKTGARAIAGDAFGAAPPAPPIPQSTGSAILAATVAAACCLIVAYLEAGATRRVFGGLTPLSVGYFIGRCVGVFFFPVVGTTIYYVIRKRKPALGHRLVVTCGWTLVALALSIAGEATVRRRARAEYAERLARIERNAEAFANKSAPPVAVSPLWDAPKRAFFADVAAFHNQYLAETATADTSDLRNLYTPGSFQNSAQMQKIVAQAEGRAATDRKFASIRPLLGKMRERLLKVQATPEEQRELVRGGLFDSATRVKMDLRDESIQDEAQWMQSAAELYRFALTNQKAFSIEGQRTAFPNEALGRQFARLLARSRELRAQTKKTMDEFASTQAIDLNQLSFQPIETGTESAEIQSETP